MLYKIHNFRMEITYFTRNQKVRYGDVSYPVS